MKIGNTSLVISLNKGGSRHNIVLPVTMIIDNATVKALHIYRYWTIDYIPHPYNGQTYKYQFDAFGGEHILGLPRNKLSKIEKLWMATHINNAWIIPEDVAPIDNFINTVEIRSINKSITEIGYIIDEEFNVLPEPAVGYSFKYSEINYIINYEHCINSTR